MNTDELGREAGEAFDHVKALAEQGVRFAQQTESGWSLRTKVELTIGVLAILGVLAFAYWPAKPIHEDVTPTAQVTQADGSVEAARTPNAHPPAPSHIIPRGYHEVSRDSVTVAPSVAAAASGCPPVTVNLSTVRDGSDTRVIASSPDGTVLAATYIPIEPALIPPPPKPWAAGLSYGTGKTVGLWVDRDIGRLRIGAEVMRQGDGRVQAAVRVGMRF